MSQQTKIEWAQKVWNCVRGCTKISPGCLRCYAETFAERFSGVPSHPYELGFEPRLVPEKLAAPLRWAKPTTIFVNSMSDLFHDVVPDDYIVLMAKVMKMASWHTFQVLTKRSERMRDLLSGKLRFAAELSNVWWGVSVENCKHGLPRIEHLRATPACMRFLSIEPLLEDLGELDLGAVDPFCLSEIEDPVLFQTMGCPWPRRRQAVEGRQRSHARRPDLRRDAAPRRDQARVARRTAHDDHPDRCGLAC